MCVRWKVQKPVTWCDYVVHNCSKKGARPKHVLNLKYYVEWVAWGGVLGMVSGLSAQKLEQSVNSYLKHAMWSVVESLSFCRMKFFFLLGEIHISVDLLTVDFGQTSRDETDTGSAAGSSKELGTGVTCLSDGMEAVKTEYIHLDTSTFFLSFLAICLSAE